ncbi:MAG: hypothetical protein IJY09_01560 [Lachnospiraceae bacterium]|nr:hypothetical protein [Lachnospiraceae bacterium]
MKKSKAARVVAILGIVLLLGMYVATFVAAITASPYASRMFMGCLLCTVFVPIFLHILIRMFQMMSEKKEGSMTLHELHQQRKQEKKENKEV